MVEKAVKKKEETTKAPSAEKKETVKVETKTLEKKVQVKKKFIPYIKKENKKKSK